jgi:hypothetical protein
MFDLTNEIYHDADKAREHLKPSIGPMVPSAAARDKRLAYRRISEASHA